MSLKKLPLVLLCMLLIGLCTVNPVKALDASTLRLSINDEVSDIEAVSMNNTFYVPLRELSEALHLEMLGTVHIVTVKGNEGSLIVYQQEKKAVMPDGREEAIQPFNRNGKLMIPVRVVSSSFGYSISYESQANLLRIQDSRATLSKDDFIAKYTEELKPKETIEKPAQQPTKKPTVPKGKVVYLTFDDGPTATTGQLLDILAKNQVKATFFMIGNNVQKYPSAVKRTLSDGHALGLHGLTHVKGKFYKSPSSALAEMDTDNKYIEKITGVRSTLIRPPYGSKPYFTQTFRNKVLGQGYHLWDWNVDSLDWKYKEATASIYNTVMNQVHKLEKSKTTPIILMHDQKPTLKALPQIIASLKKEGYSFEIITEGMTPINFWEDKR
ncbi:polysaccharide deacetylase [Paenibacillus macquariensis]|uniref:Peptidoglycan/xylan/chitin deacetylase, PgdA/CDA1 family n=1 Tax=Paenibacillus macquariensis TaxID=948756 RepID=A0ABY1K316_9BACL|nr:polysaccharide deacetylase family protein [Paenibacillus macquariensis]MEC0090304.1 polysaccharide deacetylase family protein [Paenibacillus macquariensis]OAB39662.1 hypothetical protein PMSM_00605 [Paenibacillus macquariensis subsp. macquariensis]SIR19150.1 Peptidoglycan/xylan/chitin deacetylase, PgdA/CDA1 family [Paenibacillus macquariensis]